ncbi:MAG: DUF4921 family protein [Planctomycetota bacterium]
MAQGQLAKQSAEKTQGQSLTDEQQTCASLAANCNVPDQKAAPKQQLLVDRDRATSNEMRYDWLADRWVIIAPQRTARPDDFIKRPVQVQSAEECPFCHGREDETPEAVASYSAPGDDSWAVRVVPNKFPAVSAADPGLSFVPKAAPEADERIDLFQRRELCGAHEVVIECPTHLSSLSQLDRQAVQLVFKAYRDRLYHWLHKEECEYAVLFKNVGQDAGASLAHSHSQLIATNHLPNKVSRTIDRMRLFEEKESTCLHCRMLKDELENEVRIVEQTPDFVAFCPFASRIPFLQTIVPRRHQAHFELLDDFGLEQLSWLSHRLIRRLENLHPESSYNFVIHTAPSSVRDASFYHWRMELFPRLTKLAGFEWGSDCFINPITPEDAARRIRAAGV